jgi:hypothetical protein
MKILLQALTSLALILVPFLTAPSALAAPPGPSEFLGFELGADRTLADYGQVSDYLRELAKGSPGWSSRCWARPPWARTW